MALEKLEFQTNVPVELALHYTKGKPVESRFGGMQRMFTSDRGVFYVAGVVGDVLENQIEDLRIQPGERVEICKREVANGRSRKAIRWQVARVEVSEPAPAVAQSKGKPAAIRMNVVGERSGGTFAVPGRESRLERQLRESIEHVETQKANGKAALPASAAVIPVAATSWAQFLLAQTNALVDTYALALKHASEQHGNTVKAEDIRALLTTAFINANKNGASYAG